MYITIIIIIILSLYKLTVACLSVSVHGEPSSTLQCGWGAVLADGVGVLLVGHLLDGAARNTAHLLVTAGAQNLLVRLPDKKGRDGGGGGGGSVVCRFFFFFLAGGCLLKLVVVVVCGGCVVVVAVAVVIVFVWLLLLLCDNRFCYVVFVCK